MFVRKILFESLVHETNRLYNECVHCHFRSNMLTALCALMMMHMRGEINSQKVEGVDVLKVRNMTGSMPAISPCPNLAHPLPGTLVEDVRLWM